MEIGLIRSVDIDHEMQQAYLDYAMSVIVARALPDARDGLKPVHRRILYAMYDMGLHPNTAYKKSARIVGEVLGKYHPHGDMAVYEAMARMAQDFSMRYMLVDGQGNFGSVDGDPPAAMRYTEARLANPATEMLADIQKNTVNFLGNFDDTLSEPDVLPSALPNLLVNGATGIAVGMSTSIPPHNLVEIIDALNYMLTRWEELDDITVDDLMQFVKGPDFPTGGILIQGSTDEDSLTSAYGSGRGRVVVQARAHMEEMGRGRNRIIVTELPYMTNKASLIERIAELVRDGRLDGIADLRDESDRRGMRIVIELTKSVEPEQVLQELYKATPMRSTFPIILLALVDGEPRTLSLKQALRVYLDHRLVVIKRRTEFDLEKARARAHILEGYRIALKNLDAVIELIRKSPDVETARTRLMKRFRLSEIQAQAILDMPLRRLAALERKKIEDEYKELQAQIKELESLLRSAKKMRQLASDELTAVKERYGDRRRTQIVYRDGKSRGSTPLLVSDLTPDHTVWVAAVDEGLIWRSMDDNPPRQSGREAPRFLARVSTRDTLYLVSEQGEAAAVPVHSIPEAESQASAAAIWKVSALTEQDKLVGLFTLPPKEQRTEEGYLFTATRQGLVKKSSLSELPGPSSRTFTVVKVNEGDRLGWVRLTDGKAGVLLTTANGMAIRFSEDEVRPMGLVAAGVGGIKLAPNDELVGMEMILPKSEILLVASDGKAKRLALEQFPVQGRYGQGVVAWKLPRGVTLIGIAAGKGTLRLTLHLEKLAAKVIRLDEAPLQTRAASGKPVVELKDGDCVNSLSLQQDLAHENGKTNHEPDKGSPERKPRKPAAVKPALAEADEETGSVLPDSGGQDGEVVAVSEGAASPVKSSRSKPQVKARNGAKAGGKGKTARTSSKKSKTGITPKAAETSRAALKGTAKPVTAKAKLVAKKPAAKAAAADQAPAKMAAKPPVGKDKPTSKLQSAKPTVKPARADKPVEKAKPAAKQSAASKAADKTLASIKTTGKPSGKTKTAVKPAAAEKPASKAKPASKKPAVSKAGDKKPARKPAANDQLELNLGPAVSISPMPKRKKKTP